MKIEGMDAAVKIVTVPAQPPEQAQAAAAGGAKSKSTEPFGNAKPKSPDTIEKAGAQGKTIIKVRIATDNQADKTFPQQDEGASEKQVREAIERVNRMLFGTDRKFEITIHEKTKDIMVKVVDTNTNETIREIPPQKIVDLVVHLCEIAGILFDEKG